MSHTNRIWLAGVAFLAMMIASSAHADLGDQIAKLLPDDGAEGDSFGVSIGIAGTIAIFGAWHDDDNGIDSGSAYLFDISDPANPLQIAKLLASDGAAGDNFSQGIAISGATVIVGARNDDDNGTDSGSAYLFDISDPANPVEISKLLPDDGAAEDDFGISIAISGDTVIIGASQQSSDGTGYACVFDISDPANPVQIAKLLANDGAADDFFAIVAISGAIAIVGAFSDDDNDNGSNSGSAYLFDTNTGKQIAKLLPSDGEASDWFGYTVAINGATAIVGAYSDDDTGSNSGSAYLFDITDPAKPMQLLKLLPDDGAANDHFGNSVAISGGIAIVGAVSDDPAGSAYLFDVDAVAGKCPWDLNDDNLVGTTDLLLLLGSWGDPYGTADLIELLGNWGPCR